MYKSKEKRNAYIRKWRKENRDKTRGYQKRNLQRNRLKIIKLLGGKCCKCGYMENNRALQIDHVHGDRKREKYKSGTRSYYIYVKKKIEEGSKDYQLLCANCNFIKRYEKKEYGSGGKRKMFKAMLKECIPFKIDESAIHPNKIHVK